MAEAKEANLKSLSPPSVGTGLVFFRLRWLLPVNRMEDGMKICSFFLSVIALCLSHPTLGGGDQSKMVAQSDNAEANPSLSFDKIKKFKDDLNRILSLNDSQVIDITIRANHINYFNRRSLWVHGGYTENYVSIKISDDNDKEIADQIISYIEHNKNKNRAYMFEVKKISRQILSVS